MKPTGSPPGKLRGLPVDGSVPMNSDEWSARTMLMAMSGPSGRTVPPLFILGACAASSRPSVVNVS